MKTVIFDAGLEWMKEHPGKKIKTNYGAEWYYLPENDGFVCNGKPVKQEVLDMLVENTCDIGFIVPCIIEPITFEDTVMFNDDGDCFIYVPKPLTAYDKIKVTIELIS